MKKLVRLLFVLVTVMSLCAACGPQTSSSPNTSAKEEKDETPVFNGVKFTVTEETLQNDLRKVPLDFPGVITAMEVKETRANNDEGTQVTVEVEGVAESTEVRMTAEYYLSYELTGEGWAFLGGRRNDAVVRAYVPLAGVDKTVADKEYGNDSATLVDQKENLTAGLCTFTYETVETGAYATITTKETLHYLFDTVSGEWRFKETTTDEESGVWQLNGLWLARSGYEGSQYVKLTVVETGADYLHIVVNAQGEGGVIFDDKVAFDPVKGIDKFCIENPIDSWDNLYLHIDKDLVSVSRISGLSTKSTYMEREDLFPPAMTAGFPADTIDKFFTYKLDKGAGTAVIRSYKGREISELALPSEIDGCTVIGIDEGAFAHHDEIKGLILPSTVAFIGNNAFEGCVNLYSISLPEGLTHIGDYAFYDCDVLFDFTLPESLQTIGKYAFADTGFDSIVLPESITEIAEGVFSDSNLRYITLGSSLTAIGKEAFYSTRIQTLTVPGTIKVIEEGTFRSCGYLEELTIEEGVEVIGEGAFAYNNLTELVFPDSVRELGKEAFRGCKKLESITLSPNIKTIPFCCFANAEALSTLNIPEGITTIGEGAFGVCLELNVVGLPASIKSIEDYAFERAESLTTIYFAGTEAQWETLASALKDNEYANRYVLEANIKSESQMP